MKEPDIEIICPKCSKKAFYYASGWTNEYISKPKNEGIIKCVNCGLIKNHSFSNTDYYYKIDVENRTLYARNRNNLMRIRRYFDKNLKRSTDPELDFPKEFYKKRMLIVKLIDKKLSL